MKKILGIMGSPRKGGNTDVLLSEVGKGVCDAGGEIEVVPLMDGLVSECDGCHVCWSQKPCSKKDGMNALFPKIAACDAMLLGTPVYWFGPTALMKAFIDRFVYFNCEENRAIIRGKAVALVIPYEDESFETVAPVIDFFERSFSYLEMTIAGRVIAPGVTKRGEVKSRESLMTEAYQLGLRLAK